MPIIFPALYIFRIIFFPLVLLRTIEKSCEKLKWLLKMKTVNIAEEFRKHSMFLIHFSPIVNCRKFMTQVFLSSLPLISQINFGFFFVRMRAYVDVFYRMHLKCSQYFYSVIQLI